MRRVRYNCAMSIDGYIADPYDGFDWIDIDPDIDFEELSSQFDTYLMGRRTFEVVGWQGSLSSEIRNYVFSNTLKQSDHGNLRIISEDWVEAVRALRAEPGKDIWLFGGGVLFGTLCNEGLVDTLEVSVLPVLLGGGVPLVAGLSSQVNLILKEHRVYEKTGTALLVYDIDKTHSTGKC
ncbi:MAG: dihydrofolate reductase family protein [Caldilineaceae bacterium]|nr:dihydrofolate reductase family protein [Caldilineaceae bacterium]